MERWAEVEPIRTIRTAAQLTEVMDGGCSRSNMSAAFWKQVFNGRVLQQERPLTIDRDIQKYG